MLARARMRRAVGDRAGSPLNPFQYFPPAKQGSCIEVLPPREQVPVCPDPVLLETFRQAMIAAFCSTPPISVEPTPHAAPSYRASEWYMGGLSILSSTAPGTGAAAMLSTATGMGVTAATPTVTVPALATTPTTIDTYVVPSGVEIRLASFGWRPHSFFGRIALLPRIFISGSSSALNSGTDGELTYAPPESPFPLHFIAREGQTINIQFTNRNTLSPYLIEYRLLGWSYPVVARSDALANTLVRGNPGGGGCGL